MEPSIGVNLRVTAHSSQGGRKYMEDMFCVAYQPTSDEKDLLYAYFGIFDGHGGREAALYAKQHLMDHIVSQKNFWSDDDQLVLKAIRDGFISTHFAMWKDLENWPKTPAGLPSTSGTTASIGFVRRGKLYLGHVGDSAIILGYQDPECGYWRAKSLTKDHKPESAAENARITQCGGKVISKSGVPRVVWNRPRVGHRGPVRRSTLIDEIPFLAVARSLGDLWSYNSAQNEFIVSPEPDVSVIEIDVNIHRCLILGSDGLWNMLSPQDAVNTVYFTEKNNERQLLACPPETVSAHMKNWINPSKRLVDRALDRWLHHNLRADNTSVVTVVIDPPGWQVLRQNQKSYVIRHSSSSVADPNLSRSVSDFVPPSQLTKSPHKLVPSSADPSTATSSPMEPRSSLSTPPTVQKNITTSKYKKTAFIRLAPDLPEESGTQNVAKKGLRKRKEQAVIDYVPTTGTGTVSRRTVVSSSGSNTRKKHNLAQKKKTVSSQVASKHDDVQIHEISSSCEENTGPSFSKRRKFYDNARELERQKPTQRNLRSGPSTTRSYKVKFKQQVKKYKSTSVHHAGKDNSRPRNTTLRLRKKEAAKSCRLARSSTKGSEVLKVKFKVPARDNKRSLRSSIRSTVRLTRSMTRN